MFFHRRKLSSRPEVMATIKLFLDDLLTRYHTCCVYNDVVSAFLCALLIVAYTTKLVINASVKLSTLTEAEQVKTNVTVQRTLTNDLCLVKLSCYYLILSG